MRKVPTIEQLLEELTGLQIEQTRIIQQLVSRSGAQGQAKSNDHPNTEQEDNWSGTIEATSAPSTKQRNNTTRTRGSGRLASARSERATSRTTAAEAFSALARELTVEEAFPLGTIIWVKNKVTAAGTRKNDGDRRGKVTHIEYKRKHTGFTETRAWFVL